MFASIWSKQPCSRWLCTGIRSRAAVCKVHLRHQHLLHPQTSWATCPQVQTDDARGRPGPGQSFPVRHPALTSSRPFYHHITRQIMGKGVEDQRVNVGPAGPIIGSTILSGWAERPTRMADLVPAARASTCLKSSPFSFSASLLPHSSDGGVERIYVEYSIWATSSTTLRRIVLHHH